MHLYWLGPQASAESSIKTSWQARSSYRTCRFKSIFEGWIFFFSFFFFLETSCCELLLRKSKISTCALEWSPASVVWLRSGSASENIWNRSKQIQFWATTQITPLIHSGCNISRARQIWFSTQTSRSWSGCVFLLFFMCCQNSEIHPMDKMWESI